MLVSLSACVAQSVVFSMYPRTHTVRIKAISCMHALCSPFSLMQHRKRLWTMINGYLPLALERTAHSLEKTWRLCLSKMVLFYWVLGILEQSVWQMHWIFAHSTLKQNGTEQRDYASHIFTNCHPNNKQRTHIAQGENMHAKILFPLKVHGRPFILACECKRSNISGIRLRWHCRCWWKTISRQMLSCDTAN